jgi:PucR C-terminal helix-turn-helix domain/GGDEF-like domain
VTKGRRKGPGTHARPPTLAGVLESLGPEVVRPLAAPRGLELEVGQPLIHDRLETPRLGRGDLVLAVGVALEGPEVLELVDQAAAHQAAAVVVKSTASQQLVRRCEEAGVALLEAPPELSWSQLHTFLRTATAPSGAALGGTAGDVPAGDLFALADAIAAVVGGATTIEDRRSVVLAYSSGDEPIDQGRRQTILGRRVPERWLLRLERDGVFRRLWATDDVVDVDYTEVDGLRRRLAIAVRAGGEALGSIWVSEGREPFRPGSREALREAARVAALHLIRHQAGESIARRRRGELLRAALEGRGELLPDALGTRGPFAVVAVKIVAPDHATRTIWGERAFDIVSLHCERRHQAACVAVDGVLYVALAGPQASLGHGRPAAEEIVALLAQRAPVPLRAAIGSPARAPGELARSRAEAELALAATAETAEPGSVVSADNVRGRILLERLRQLAAGDASLREGSLETLREHDARRGTRYVETLAAYLDAFGDVRRAAASLDVHPNTFRYRLQRLVELSRIDLDDPVERLVVQLQLRLG